MEENKTVDTENSPGAERFGEKKKREPLIHITKRDGMTFSRGMLIRVIAVISAILVTSILAFFLLGKNPVDLFSAIMNGTFGTADNLWVALRNTAILLLISLAVTPAFKMRFWNIGAEGQVYAGALGCAFVMIECGGLGWPEPVLLGTMLVAALLAGAIWAVIPAIFKVWFGTNETLFTLMMNYIIMNIITFCTLFFGWGASKGSTNVGLINFFTGKQGWLPDLLENPYLLVILLALVITVIMYIYLRFSKQGYEISVVGESEKTARYVGIGVGRVVIRTMLITGALCGLVGFLLVSGVDHTVDTRIVDSRGFTAIMVSWLSKFNPFIMIGTSFLLVFLDKGASEMASSLRLDSSFGDIMTGIIILFIIGCEFFINYRVHFRKSQKEEVTAV